MGIEDAVMVEEAIHPGCSRCSGERPGHMTMKGGARSVHMVLRHGTSSLIQARERVSTQIVSMGVTLVFMTGIASTTCSRDLALHSLPWGA